MARVVPLSEVGKTCPRVGFLETGTKDIIKWKIRKLTKIQWVSHKSHIFLPGRNLGVPNFQTVLWNDYHIYHHISPLSIFFIPQCSDYGWGWWLKTTMTWGFYPTGQTPARSSIQTIQNFIPWHCWWFRNPANQIWLVVYPTLCRWTYTY